MASSSSSSSSSGSRSSATNSSVLDEREQMRMEFYATYDVMTGVRIAATLGGFFGLMVFLVIYKSRSKTIKALKDPKIAEIAAAVVAEEEAQEEERQLVYALEAALGARCSLSGLSGPAWPPWPPSRFSSVGGYSSLLAPPRRLSKARGDSLPGSALRFDYRPPFYADDIEMTDAIDDSSCTAPSEYANRFLSVPGGSRRYSSITCSSSGSSYLERRGSSMVCALPAMPPSPPCPRARRARRVGSHPATDTWKAEHPIDIQVIQATPELSPCVSEHTVLDCKTPPNRRKESGNSGTGASNAGRPLAPLASLGSCGVSLSVDYQDYDLHSVGSDSVFMDEDDCLDTDDEIEQFSTDSDDSVSYKTKGRYADDARELRPRRRSRHIVGKSVPVAASPPLGVRHLPQLPQLQLHTRVHSSRSPLVRKHPAFLGKPLTRRALRRLSHPAVLSRLPQPCSTISAAVQHGSAAVEEEPFDSLQMLAPKTSFPSLPFGTPRGGRAESLLSHSRSQDVELGCRAPPCPSPAPVLPTSSSALPLVPSISPEHCSWSQETLF